MDISSPRRSSRTTPSKYKSMSTEISSPIKLIYLSTSCEVPENEGSDSGVENVKKKMSTKPTTIQEDSDSDSELKVDCDDDSEGQQPSSTVKNGDSPSAPKHRRGLRDLKVTGKVPNDWSSDESDELPNIRTSLIYIVCSINSILYEYIFAGVLILQIWSPSPKIYTNYLYQ